MRTFTYLLILLSLLAISGLFILKRPDGKSWMQVEDIMPNTTSLVNKVVQLKGMITSRINTFFSEETKAADANLSASQTQVFRWHDEQGTEHYSDSPPSKDKSEKVIIDANRITVIPAFEVTEQDFKIHKSTKIEKRDTALPALMTIEPDEISKLIKDAKNIENLLKKRDQQLIDLINK